MGTILGGTKMKKAILTSALSLALFAAGTTFALADPIEGKWMTGDKVLLNIKKCGGSFCVKVVGGKYDGKQSGKLKPAGDKVYKGTLKQFSSGISFAGTATLSGNSMKMIAKKFGITVKKDTWKRK